MRLLFLLVLLTGPLLAQSRFSVPTPADADSVAARLSRTARLLHTDGQEVRILVYGQSISAQDWWLEVRHFLGTRYPKARLLVENRAIGGFSSDRLKLMVANDVVSFYPDLILLHDYGGEPDYEAIVRTIRSCTTAELALQTDHVGVGQNDTWHDRHGNDWMPALCRRYGLARIDVRTAWKNYLAANKLPAQALLTDNVHLNEHGNYLMAEIIKRYLERLPALPSPDTLPRRLLAGRDFTVRRRRVRVPIRGNRVDLVWQPAADTSRSVSVRLDGQKPTALPGSYVYTRPTRKPDDFFLTDIGQPLQLHLGRNGRSELWTLTVTDVDTVRQQVRFSVAGSLTGHDGAGSSDQPFRSRSGRIRIDSTGWFRRRNPDDFRQFTWVQPGATFRWQVVPISRSSVKPAAAPVTVIQGVAPGEHVLELTGRGVSALREIRVYEPPLPLDEPVSRAGR